MRMCTNGPFTLKMCAGTPFRRQHVPELMIMSHDICSFAYVEAKSALMGP